MSQFSRADWSRTMVDIEPTMEITWSLRFLSRLIFWETSTE